MASADQLKALLDSFVERDAQRFFSGRCRSRLMRRGSGTGSSRRSCGPPSTTRRVGVGPRAGRRSRCRSLGRGGNSRACWRSRTPGTALKDGAGGGSRGPDHARAAGAAPRGANPRTRAGPVAEAAAGRPAGDGQDDDGVRAGRRAGPAAVPGAARWLDHEEGGGTTWARSGACSTASCRGSSRTLPTA